VIYVSDELFQPPFRNHPGSTLLPFIIWLGSKRAMCLVGVIYIYIHNIYIYREQQDLIQYVRFWYGIYIQIIIRIPMIGCLKSTALSQGRMGVAEPASSTEAWARWWKWVKTWKEEDIVMVLDNQRFYVRMNCWGGIRIIILWYVVFFI
jgi:hypothetical protein